MPPLRRVQLVLPCTFYKPQVISTVFFRDRGIVRVSTKDRYVQHRCVCSGVNGSRHAIEKLVPDFGRVFRDSGCTTKPCAQTLVSVVVCSCSLHVPIVCSPRATHRRRTRRMSHRPSPRPRRKGSPRGCVTRIPRSWNRPFPCRSNLTSYSGTSLRNTTGSPRTEETLRRSLSAPLWFTTKSATE